MKKITIPLFTFFISFMVVAVGIDAAGKGKVFSVFANSLSEAASKAWKKSSDSWDSYLANMKKRLKNETINKKDGEIKDGIKYVLSGTSIQAPLSTHQKIPFSVSPSPESANVRIMNISEKYSDGILLKPGRYDIEVSHNGFRTKRFWVDADKEFNEVAVQLSQKGGIICNPVVARSGSGLSGTGSKVKVEMDVPGISISELYFSYAEILDETNFNVVIDSGITEKYAYFDLVQSSHLSKNAIANNREVRIDPNRNVRQFIGMEALENNATKLVSYGEIPPGAFAYKLKEAFCLGVSKL